MRKHPQTGGPLPSATPAWPDLVGLKVVRQQERLPFSMDLNSIPEEAQGAADLAYALLLNSMSRDMEYEEFTFQMEGGPEDGEEYKIIVMKI